MPFNSHEFYEIIDSIADIGILLYLLDNEMQLVTALEDYEYTLWLDPDPEVGAYRHHT